MAKGDEAAEKDWRAEAARVEDSPLALSLARAAERGRGREALAPSEIPARGWRDILWRVVWAIPEDRVLSTAGSVAFFALLAVFPAIATVVSLYGLFADAASIRGHLALLDGVVPDGVLALIGDELARVATQRGDRLGLAFVIGLAIALWSANSGVAALFDALNVVYKEREKRSLTRFYATTFLFTIGGVLFVLAPSWWWWCCRWRLDCSARRRRRNACWPCCAGRCCCSR
jgi:membrane protein